jgi:hypothetical protein
MEMNPPIEIAYLKRPGMPPTIQCTTPNSTPLHTCSIPAAPSELGHNQWVLDMLVLCLAFIAVVPFIICHATATHDSPCCAPEVGQSKRRKRKPAKRNRKTNVAKRVAACARPGHAECVTSALLATTSLWHNVVPQTCTIGIHCYLEIPLHAGSSRTKQCPCELCGRQEVAARAVQGEIGRRRGEGHHPDRSGASPNKPPLTTTLPSPFCLTCTLH